MEEVPNLLFVNHSYDNQIRAFDLVGKTSGGLYVYKNRDNGCTETFTLFDIQCLASPIRPSQAKYERSPRMHKYIPKRRRK